MSPQPEKKALPVLHPFYYLDNFELVLDWVRSRYDDILLEHERQFIADFFTLPQTSRALFVRCTSGSARFARLGLGGTRSAHELGHLV